MAGHRNKTDAFLVSWGEIARGLIFLAPGSPLCVCPCACFLLLPGRPVTTAAVLYSSVIVLSKELQRKHQRYRLILTCSSYTKFYNFFHSWSHELQKSVVGNMSILGIRNQKSHPTQVVWVCNSKSENLHQEVAFSQRYPAIKRAPQNSHLPRVLLSLHSMAQYVLMKQSILPKENPLKIYPHHLHKSTVVHLVPKENQPKIHHVVVLFVYLLYVSSAS
jgi:hypothetical protein